MKTRSMIVFLLIFTFIGFPIEQPSAKKASEETYKVSELIGKQVRNPQGQELGVLEEVVVGKNGEVGYAVLSFGGLLGLGDKLFAVPWKALSEDSDGEYLLLNFSPNYLKQAPGFNKTEWPNMDDKEWKATIAEFYRHTKKSLKTQE